MGKLKFNRDVLKHAEAALLHEAMGRRGALNHDIKPLFKGAKLYGRAFPVRCKPGDNLVVHRALNAAGAGDVLVVTVDGFCEAGGWGEITSVAATLKGLAGLVIDGSVRDVEAIEKMGFPVFCRGVSIKGTTKVHEGSMNCPITIGGVFVSPGDIVVGDSDGVVVVPESELGDVLAIARKIKIREKEILKGLRNGGTTIDLLGLPKAVEGISSVNGIGAGKPRSAMAGRGIEDEASTTKGRSLRI